MDRRPRAPRTGCAGLTLVEVMIGVILAALVLAGLAAALATTVDGQRRGVRMAEVHQTARHLASRIDRLFAGADPETVTWDTGEPWSVWIEAAPPGSAEADRTKLEWITDGTGRVVETRGPGQPGSVSEILVGVDADEVVRGAAVRLTELRFRPVVRTLAGGPIVERVEVMMMVEVREADGQVTQVDWTFTSPLNLAVARLR